MIFEPSDFSADERKIFDALRGGKAKCPTPDKLLALDAGVLPEEVAASVAAHIEACRICNTLACDLRRLRSRAPEQRRWPQFAAIAASVAAIAVLAGYWNRGGETQKHSPAQQVIVQTPRLALSKAPLKLPLASALVMRGEGASPGLKYLGQLGHALDPYRADRFDEAARRLESLAARHPASVEPVFYLGVARLMLGNAPMAVDALERAQQIGGTALENDITWYLAVAHERIGSLSRARPLIKRLCGSESAYRPSACDALGRKP